MSNMTDSTAEVRMDVLGALAFYAGNGGVIHYVFDGEELTVPVSDLVDRYRAEANPNLECWCGHPKKYEAHEHWVRIS